MSTKRPHPLRLLVVGGRWPPEAFIARRLQGLAERGFEVTVATNRGTSRTKLAGVRWKPLPVPEKAPIRSLFELGARLILGLVCAPRRTAKVWRIAATYKGWAAAWKLLELLCFVMERPDCLHFEWNFAAVYYLPLFDLLDCPSVVSCRGTQILVAPHNPERALDADRLPLTFEKVSAVHCVSAAVAGAARELGAAHSKLRVFRPAVDTDLFRPAPKTAGSVSGPFRILMTFTFNWVKGYEYALIALRQLRDDGVDAHLTIVGDGDKANRQRLLYTIHDLDLADFVSLPGAMPASGVVEQLQRSGAYLMSSVSEGISNSVLEAMSCGLPVVCTDCPGMSEVITNGVDGFLVPVREPQAMAGRLRDLAQAPELRGRVGLAARERILKEFQHSRLMNEWTGLYSELIAEQEREAS